MPHGLVRPRACFVALSIQRRSTTGSIAPVVEIPVDDKARARLGLVVDLAGVFPDHTQGQKLDAADEPDGGQGRRPSQHRMPGDPGYQRIEQHQQRKS